jgi:hypothetical protein
MYKIKVSLPNQENSLNIKDFVDNHDNIYKNYKFFINEDVVDPDFWFIVENLKNETEEACINEKNIIYLNYETSYPKDYFLNKYMQNYLSQFAKKYGIYNDFSNNYISSPPFQPWLINSSQKLSLNSGTERDFSYFLKLNKIEKKKNLSVICSTKKITDDHGVRLKFVEKLKEHFGDSLDWYGSGKIEIDKKWSGISEYKYHVVLENESRYNLISEKIYDSFLGLSYPFYHGAPNIHQYFPETSLSSINIYDLSQSIETIEIGMENNLYDKNFNSLLEAKKIVLSDFNLFTRMVDIIEESSEENFTLIKRQMKIHSVSYFWNRDVNIKQKIKHSIKRKLRLNNKNY